jgi:flap endonuclease GEN
MTVSCLWKILDSAGCGKLVGTAEICASNGSNVSASNTLRRPSLAVDLSIWICESLTSDAMNKQHANPAIYLVYSRTVKLLTLGIKLVFVVEGKRRIRGTPDEIDQCLQTRRGGTAFWKACRDCQILAQLLGVPIVKAKAEGEALCALLNQRGIVDGVISNDGDCLLFGAKHVYTKFSIENMEACRVVRYDLDDLWAHIAQDNDDKDKNNDSNRIGYGKRFQLSRQDLIAFALLTGSDLTGDGMPKVGGKKAAMFLRQCKMDNPLTPESAAITELSAWAKASMVNPSNAVFDIDESQCCSRCCHVGSKQNHKRFGCKICDTQGGEQCHKLSLGDRFRKSLRAKALAMKPRFDPSFVLSAYLKPNDDQLPFQLVGVTSTSLSMGQPDFRNLLTTPLLIKGLSHETSRTFIKQSIPRLMARMELFRLDVPTTRHDIQSARCLSREHPVPEKITKRLVRKHEPFFQVCWTVKGTITDENGEDMDGYTYLTIEPCSLIEARYPFLVEAFKEYETENVQQGNAELMRRHAFLEMIFGDRGDQVHKHDEENLASKRSLLEVKKRGTFFQTSKAGMRPTQCFTTNSVGDDVQNLIRSASAIVSHRPSNNIQQLPKVDVIACKRGDLPMFHSIANKRMRDEETRTPVKLPSNVRLFCEMGIAVEISPVVGNRGVFPPHHIFIRSKACCSEI